MEIINSFEQIDPLISFPKNIFCMDNLLNLLQI